MKNFILILFLLSSIYSFSQDNKSFKQPYITFDSCKDSENKKECFDDLIIERMLKASKDAVVSHMEKYPDCGSVSLHVSFVVGENGRPIDESIKTTKNAALDVNEKLDNVVKNLPDISPLRNEYNYEILSYYFLFIDVTIDENKELVLLEKSTEPIELSENSCCVTPIYKGCESSTTNKELKKCFSDNISKIIGQKFNINKAFKKFDKRGTFNTYILFNIDKKGEVSDVLAFGPSKEITAEALRSFGKIKPLQPGTKDGEPVIVPFMLPIKLKK